MYGNRYYPGRWNPYNRHDTGMYVVYRAKDGKHIGTVVDCYNEREAKQKARLQYGCEVYVSEIEE